MTSTGVGEPRDLDWQARVVGRSVGAATDRALIRGHAFLAAARRLLLRSGGDDFTMQQVAGEAGLSLRALYQHFDGKDDLLVALVEESQVHFARVIEEQIEPLDDPLRRLGGALLVGTSRLSHASPSYTAAIARYGVQTSLTAPEDLGRARRPVLGLFTELIVDATAAGVIAPPDPESAAATLYLVFVAYGTNEYLGTSLGAPSPPAVPFVRFCLLGLGARLPDGWECALAEQLGTAPTPSSDTSSSSS